MAHECTSVSLWVKNYKKFPTLRAFINQLKITNHRGKTKTAEKKKNENGSV